MPVRLVYPSAELAHPGELTQPVPVDGSSYLEPLLRGTDVEVYTAEDDAAPQSINGAVTISSSAVAGDTAILVFGITDETDTAQVGTVPATTGQNENQTLDSDHTGGTFELDFDGQVTTASLDAAAETAANVELALEALSNLAVGDVTVTGGPLPAQINIEFTAARALNDQPEIVPVDSGTGGTDGVVVTTVNDGAAVRNFAFEGVMNIPRGGDQFQPMGHVYSLDLNSGDAGVDVDIQFADHGTLRSLVAIMGIVTNLDGGAPIEVFSTDEGNAERFGSFPSVTPLTNGAKVMAVLMKALDGGAGTYFTASDSPAVPSGLIGMVEGLSDAITATAWLSGVLDTDPFDAPDASWSQLSLWATAMLVLQPVAAASAGASLAAVTDAEDVQTWIDISNAAGSMNEVLELDLSTIPADAVITAANVEIGHSASVRNPLRAVLVGIDPDDTVRPAVEQAPSGYYPTPLGTLVEIATADWQTIADGTPLASFDRLGVRIISSEAHPFVADHHVFWIRSRISYDEGGPVVSNVAGPVSAGDPFTWDYASGSGLGQTHYQLMVIEGSAQDPDAATVAANPLEAATGEIVFDSGQVASNLARSLTVEDAPLGRGTQTLAVRAWAMTSSGVSVVSDWDTADFDIPGSPVGPGAQAVDPVFDPVTGGVDVEVTVPASVSRAWLLRSEDSGATWATTQGSPFTVTPLGTETITDFFAPTLVSTIRYRVTFDDGGNRETEIPVAVEAAPGTDISTPAAEWYFRVDDDPTLNTPVFVQDWKTRQGLRTQVAEQGGADDTEPSRALVASSKPLATTLELNIWLRSGAERRAVVEVLRSGLPIRVSDIWGREYLMKPRAGQSLNPRRSKSTLSSGLAEGIKLKDLSVLDVVLVGSVIVE